MAVAADTHPGIFAHALSKVQAGEDFIFRAINVAGIRPQPKVYLVECKDNLLIRGLRAKFVPVAFVAIGFLVDKGLPDRYHREWVI